MQQKNKSRRWRICRTKKTPVAWWAVCPANTFLQLTQNLSGRSYSLCRSTIKIGRIKLSVSTPRIYSMQLHWWPWPRPCTCPSLPPGWLSGWMERTSSPTLSERVWRSRPRQEHRFHVQWSRRRPSRRAVDEMSRRGWTAELGHPTFAFSVGPVFEWFE